MVWKITFTTLGDFPLMLLFLLHIMERQFTNIFLYFFGRIHVRYEIHVHDDLFVLMLYIAVNNFSVMSGQFPAFLG